MHNRKAGQKFYVVKQPSKATFSLYLWFRASMLEKMQQNNIPEEQVLVGCSPRACTIDQEISKNLRYSSEGNLVSDCQDDQQGKDGKLIAPTINEQGTSLLY